MTQIVKGIIYEEKMGKKEYEVVWSITRVYISKVFLEDPDDKEEVFSVVEEDEAHMIDGEFGIFEINPVEEKE